MQKKSKAAFEHNVKAEVEAGKPLKQSLAIAYATKRRAKMSNGGMVLDQSMEQENMDDPQDAFLTEDMESPWEDEEADNSPQERAPDIEAVVKNIRRKRMMP
jgi:hypothetical protein